MNFERLPGSLDPSVHVDALDSRVMAGEIDLYSVVTYGADPTGAEDATPATRSALAAAWANVQATGRRSVVYWPSGQYRYTGRTVPQHLDIRAMHNLLFLGEPGRSYLYLTGDSRLSDWYLFNVRGNASNIEFRNLRFDMTGITNPDRAEQNHLLQIGNTGATDIRIVDCEFLSSVGDGIRLTGEFGTPTTTVQIHRCRFTSCTRAGVSFQRWVRKVQITDCYFVNGTDQQIDFEPSGYSFEADNGGSGTVLVDADAHFVTWGMQAGDPVFNGTDNVIVKIVSVDSQTQLTTTAGSTSWNGANYSFPLHNSHHLIAHNRFVRGTNPTDVIVALTGTYGTIFADNEVEGSINGIDTVQCSIANNRITTQYTGHAGIRAIELFKSVAETSIVDNIIALSATPATTLQWGIYVSDQAGRGPDSVLIARNTIHSDTRCTGIFFEGGRRCQILDNKLVLNTPGESNKSVGIYVRPVSGLNVTTALVSGNDLRASQGGWLNGIDFDANGATITSCSVLNNVISSAVWPIRTVESHGGRFTNPPLVIGNIVEDGTKPTLPPASTPWLVIGGISGSAATGFKPQVFWGQGSPDGVLAAGTGSLALRSDGGAGTCLYVKENGADTTGWVSNAPIAADIKRVDTILGAAPPAARTGDLATNTGPALGASVVLAQGCVTPGDGGGGVFYWSAESRTDDGGTVIVPNGHVGATGPCWRRIHGGPLNVRFFGAQGDNNTSDDRAINLAIQATFANGGAGGDVYIPPGRYKTTAPIIIDLPSIRLSGSGTGTIIAGVGGFNTIAINSTGTAGCRFIEIGSFFLDDSLKDFGRCIEVFNTGNLRIVDIIAFRPWEGVHLHNFNHVEIERVGVTGPRGPDGYGFWLSGGGTLGDGRSDVIVFRDTTVEGLGFAGVEGCVPGTFCPQGRRHGLIIDGAVNTVSSQKFYLLALQGAGIWFRNHVNAATNPEFASFYGLEIDFPQFEGIRIEVGQRLHFTDVMVHGSHERTNIAVGADPDTTVNTVTFKGGFSSGAALSGIDIWARDVCVQGMNVLFNAGARRNDINGPAGLEVFHSARRVTITGNTIGDEASSHNFGVKVESGADEYSIVGNITSANSFGGIRNFPGRAPGQREIVGNVGSVV